jgi:hypothetical protein
MRGGRKCFRYPSWEIVYEMLSHYPLVMALDTSDKFRHALKYIYNAALYLPTETVKIAEILLLPPVYIS